MRRQGVAAEVRVGTQPAPALAPAAACAERAAAMPPRSGLAERLARSPRSLAQGAVVSSLQAGPRALAQRRQMATSAPARVAQRYTVVEAGQQKPNYWQGLGAALRVADDGKMAVKHINGAPKNSPDYQDFYATADIIQGSQQALTATGSAFSIAQGGGTLIGSAPGVKNAPALTLHQAATANQDLARIGKGSHTFNACSYNMHNFLGVLRSMPGNADLLERRRDIVLKLEGTLDHAQKSVVTGEQLDVAMIEARRIATGSASNGEARDRYNTMKESMRKQISAQYGIDESALPEVGQGFGIIRGGQGGRDGMGHFAPVLAVSGQDRVTLENDVGQTEGREKQAVGQINPNWYFRMFGPVKKHWYGNEDQTFWGEAKKHEKADYGDKPLVATLGSRPRED
ncbi:MAG: hypothetical protein IPO59_23375 [Betaproteobacteria bacterium]|nr:hypothetical protein [Betaproteobacteria bacterium]